MARPFEYKPGSRRHLGLRFDKALYARFDELCRRHGYSRTQALENLVTNAIGGGYIPPRNLVVWDQAQQQHEQQTPSLETVSQRPRLEEPPRTTKKRAPKQDTAQ